MKKAFKISAIVLVTLALIVIAVGTFVVNAAPTGVTETNYQEIMQTSGKYELTQDIVGQGDAKIRIGTNVTLDLKGHTITTTSASGLFYMLDSTPGTFTIKDSVGGGAIIVETADAPLFEKAGSTVYITGGTIVADRISAEGTNPDLHVIITGVGEAGDGSNVGTWTKFDPSKALGTGYTSIPEASPVDADAVNRVIPMEYTITLRSEIAGATYGGDNTKPLPYELTYRTGDPDIPLRDAVATGYTFTGWYDDKGNKITTIATGSLLNLDLTARFELTDYTINYNLPAGAVNSATNPSTFTVQTPTITLGEPTLMGATFNGWYADATLTTLITEIDCANTPNNVDVYPSFTYDDYKINYVLDGATNNGANPGTYTVQDTVTFADPVKKGYTFIGWFDADGNKITGIPAGTLASDITVYARFEITVYRINYKNVPEDAVPESNPDTYTILDNVTFAAPSMDGSDFVAWEGTTADGIVINNNQLRAGTTGDLDLTATWTLRNYRIEYILNDTAAFPVTNNPNQHILSYTMEDEIELKPAVRTHYDFVGWYDAQEDGNKVEMIEEGSTGDIKLYARWTPTDYTITYDPGQGVTDAVMPDPETYNVETAVTFPVPTREGFDFLGWNCDGTIVTDFAAGSMYGDKTLVATWRVAQYNVNVIYKLTDEYVAQNGISAADAILYTEPVTLVYNTRFTHTVNFENSKYNGFVPDQWVVDMIVPLDQDDKGDIIVYFSPVVVSTVYDDKDGEIVITYKDGTTNKIEISLIEKINLEGNALVYELSDGEKVTVASIATTTDLDEVKESVDDLNKSLADLKTALEGKDTQLAADIKDNADAIKANVDAIKKNAADILANSGKIATNAEDIKANADAIAALEAAVATINEKIGDIESNVDSLSGTDTGLVVGVIIIAVVLAGVAGCVVFLFIKQRKA